MFLDAAWVKDIVGINAGRICILTAVGITEEGVKEILGFERAQRESESSWRGFLSRLVSRGLDPRMLRLVVSDEHKGILPAISEILGDVAYQLCWAHRVRNILKGAEKKDRHELLEGLRRIYKAAHKTEAKKGFKIWRARWREKYPQLVANTEEDLGYLLSYYDCPQQHRKYLRTTNPIEREFL